jgi:hypothetical protein
MARIPSCATRYGAGQDDVTQGQAAQKEHHSGEEHHHRVRAEIRLQEQEHTQQTEHHKNRPEPLFEAAQQLPLTYHVAGEEKQQGKFQQLGRLQADNEEVDPAMGAIHRYADKWYENNK